jgi:hypothetical protein
MNWKLWRCAAALLPVSFLCAQQPGQEAPQPANGAGFHQPSPEAMQQIAEQWQRTRAQANAINDLAGHFQSPEDARKLVDLVAAEFSKELPPRWATRSIRGRIARTEYEAAADPGTLIPEQHVADAWNDFLEKIGAPQDSYVSAEDIHVLRDRDYVTAQLSWARGIQNVWTVPNIYAVGADGKVANGCRALEALNILWQLGNQPEVLKGVRELIAKDERFSDMYKNPSQPPAPGAEQGYVSAQIVRMPPNPVEQAAIRYTHDHGMRALNGAIEGLLKDLLAD